MAYIEDRIDTLEQDFDTMWSKLCALENAVYEITDGDDDHINDRVSTLEDIVENDGRKLDELAKRFSETHDKVIHDEPQVQQTTDEFVKVVRCKDCKYADIIYRTCKNLNAMKDVPVKENDYCSRGEKI